MKKYKIEIKNTEDDEIIDTYECNYAIAMTECGDFILGEMADYALIMRFVEYVIERYLLVILQRNIGIEDKKALYFKDIPKVYENKLTQRNIQMGINNLLNILVDSVENRLYEDTFRPEGGVRKAKIVSETGRTLREIDISDFCFIASGDGTNAVEFNADDEKDSLLNKIFQTACRNITYLAKLYITIENEIADKELDELLNKGDDIAYNNVISIVKGFNASVKEKLKMDYLTNKMHHNNMNMIVDIEEYHKQNTQHFIKELYKKLGIDFDDEDDL